MEVAKAALETFTLEGQIGLQIILQGKFGEFQSVFEDLQEAFGRIALDGANIADEGIAGNAEPLLTELFLIDSLVEDHNSVQVRVPAVALVGDFVAEDSASDVTEFIEFSALAYVVTPLCLVFAPGVFQVLEALLEIVAVFDRESQQSELKAGFSLAEDFEPVQVPLDLFGGTDAGADGAKHVLFTGSDLGQADLIDRIVIVKDQVIGAAENVRR